jgi:predicted Zn-ribbon and HTH transcriptional regulator
LGGGRGHVRALFPQILRYGRVIGECPKEERFELMSITCPDCGFSWEEIKFPHDTTYCPDCRNEVDLSGYFEKRK